MTQTVIPVSVTDTSPSHSSSSVISWWASTSTPAIIVRVKTGAQQNILTIWTMLHTSVSMQRTWNRVYGIVISRVLSRFRILPSYTSMFLFWNLWKVASASFIISSSFAWPVTTVWYHWAYSTNVPFTGVGCSSSSFKISVIIIGLQ